MYLFVGYLFLDKLLIVFITTTKKKKKKQQQQRVQIQLFKKGELIEFISWLDSLYRRIGSPWTALG